MRLCIRTKENPRHDCHGERKRVSLRGSASGSFPALIQCETMHHRLCSRHHTSRLPISAQRCRGKTTISKLRKTSPEKSGSYSLWMNGHFTLVGFSPWLCQVHSLCYGHYQHLELKLQN